MKYLKKFTTETDRDNFIQNADYCPIVTIVSNESDNIYVNYYDEDDLNVPHYTVNLNNEWQLSSTVANPDANTLDGVYESFSNVGIKSSYATLTITITGYSEFSLYIRSYAETNYDYVMVSQLDKTLTNSSLYSNTTLVKAHTRGNQQAGTAISNYTLVKYENIDGGEHTITVVYIKDSSTNSNADKGYVLIKK